MELESAYHVAMARKNGVAGPSGTGKCRACGLRIGGTGIRYNGKWFHTTWAECTDPVYDEADTEILTILRGVVETGRTDTYFHSTLCVTINTHRAIARGWLTGELGALTVTPAGQAAYDISGIGNFPKGYHQSWPWRTAKSVPPTP